MADYVHQRQVAPQILDRPRELIVACVPTRSNVNVSQIARTAGVCAIERLVLTGNANLISKIARDGADSLEVSIHRTLLPVLLRLKKDGYKLVGLEQTSNSQSLHDHAFERRTVLVVGNERLGIPEDILAVLDDVVEIPIWGLPHSYNLATATNMALYEYCKQYPKG